MEIEKNTLPNFFLFLFTGCSKHKGQLSAPLPYQQVSPRQNYWLRSIVLSPATEYSYQDGITAQKGMGTVGPLRSRGEY